MKKTLIALASLLVIFLCCLTSIFAAGTYTLVIDAVDKEGDPLSGAWVRVTTLYGPGDYRSSYEETNASGFAVFNDVYSSIPSANVTIYWRSVEVVYETVDLGDGENSFVIVCNVSDLTVLAQDSENNPLIGADVTLSWERDIPQTLESTTNGQGLVVFQQMPYYEYQVATECKNRQVHDGTFDFNDSATIYVADCEVHDLDVKVFDGEDRPISGAEVLISRDDGWKASELTDYGTAIFTQLAFGNYSVEASYESHSNTTTAELVESLVATLHLNIKYSPRTFEITVRAVWDDGKPTSGANVVILDSLGEVVSTGPTDDSGYFTDLLTEGEYILNVSKNDLSKVENVTLTNNTMITFSFDATQRTYALIVEVTGENGAPVDGALVQVYSNGSLIFTGETINGAAFFNLQEGTYRVVVSAGDEQREKTVELGEDARISIVFQKGAASELLLFILAVLGVLAAIVLVACARRLITSKEA
jgi:hypothetical protein